MTARKANDSLRPMPSPDGSGLRGGGRIEGNRTPGLQCHAVLAGAR